MVVCSLPSRVQHNSRLTAPLRSSENRRRTCLAVDRDAEQPFAEHAQLCHRHCGRQALRGGLFAAVPGTAQQQADCARPQAGAFFALHSCCTDLAIPAAALGFMTQAALTSEAHMMHTWA